jgi:hypothetical protein
MHTGPARAMGGPPSDPNDAIIGQQDLPTRFLGVAPIQLLPLAGIPTSFAAVPAEACAVDVNNMLQIIGVGGCTVTASLTFGGQAVERVKTFTIVPAATNKLPQSPPLTLNVSSSIVFEAPSPMSVSGGSGTGTVRYVVQDGAYACRIEGDQITGLIAGRQCVVRAEKVGDENFESTISNSVPVTVLKASQGLLAFTPKSPIVFGEEIALTASGGAGDGAITFTLLGGGAFCELAGNTLTAIAADGACTIRATKAGDNNYAEAYAEAMVNVSPKQEQAGLGVVAGPLSFPGSVTLSVTGGTTNGVVSYELLSGPCTLSGAVLSSTAVGTCTVRATMAGNGGFVEARSAPHDVAIGRNLVVEETARRMQQAMLSKGRAMLNYNPTADRLSDGKQSSGQSVSFLPQGDSGQGSIAFATSLQQIANAREKVDRQVVPTAAERPDAPPNVAPRAAGSADLWADGRFVWFDVEDGGGSQSGFLGEAGIDYLLTDDVLLGLSLRFDSTSGDDVESRGWMVGPYAVAKVVPGLRVDGRLLWGHGKGEMGVSLGGLAFEGDHVSERWLAEAGARGEIDLAPVTLEPGVRLSWWREEADGYSLSGGGGSVGDQALSLLRVSLDPRLRYVLENSGDLAVSPYITPQLIAEWRDQTGRGEGWDVFGALEAGLSVSGPSYAFGARIEASGLGSDAGQNYSTGAELAIPLN